MDMGIDQPGDHPAPFQVDRRGCPVSTMADNPPVLHGNIGILPFTGERVEDFSVQEPNICGNSTVSCRDRSPLSPVVLIMDHGGFLSAGEGLFEMRSHLGGHGHSKHLALYGPFLFPRDKKTGCSCASLAEVGTFDTRYRLYGLFASFRTVSSPSDAHRHPEQVSRRRSLPHYYADTISTAFHHETARRRFVWTFY